MTGTSRRRRSPTVDPVRLAAFDALRRVEADDAYLNLVLPGLLTERGIDGRDAAFATELAYGTVRRQGSYDAVLDACVTAGGSSLEPPVRTALRLGCHQVLAMRVPAHAAVSTTVDLVRTVAGERPVRLVNAVLRKVAARDLTGWMTRLAPARDVDPVGHLAIVRSHPRWIVEAYLNVLHDQVEVDLLLAANNEAPRVTLVARPGLSTQADLAIYRGEPGRWSPYAWRLAVGDPGALPLVRAGLAGVQDEGSQLAAMAFAAAALGGAGNTDAATTTELGTADAATGTELGASDAATTTDSATTDAATTTELGTSDAATTTELGTADAATGTELGTTTDAGQPDAGGPRSNAHPRPDLPVGHWLDLCAGPGGKAALLTGLARRGDAHLTAVEVQPSRAGLVAATLRAYPGASAVFVADGTVPAWRPGAFTAAIVDAPCTGLGALRRRPESRWRRSPGDLGSLVALQRALLESAVDSVRSGGVVAYVTCSPHRAETRDVVDAVLRRRRDVTERDARGVLVDALRSTCRSLTGLSPREAPTTRDFGPGPHIQLWPHVHGTDAMFVALLDRR